MRLAPLPAEDRLTLEMHAGDPDAPVFVYRPLAPREVARWTARLYTLYDEAWAAQPAGEGGEGEAPEGPPRRTADQAVQETYFYLDLFEDRVVRVENLTVGDAPFDLGSEEHRRALPLKWQVQAAADVLNRAQLSEDERGKSSSPSASG